MEEIGIGKMAELNCVSIRTLRLYHEKGLLEPVRVDEETGYRYYSYDQCSQLDMIVQLQELGLSLEEIKSFTEAGAIAALEEAVHRHVCKIDEQIRDLEIARHNALSFIRGCQIFETRPECDSPHLEYCRNRTMLVFPILEPTSANLDVDGNAYVERWEVNLRLTKRYMIDNGYPRGLFRNIGCTVALEDLKSRTLKLKGSVTFVANTDCGQVRGAKSVPAGQYLVMYKDRYVTEDGRNTEVDGILALLNYAKEHGLEITGDYIGEIIADTPAFNFRGRDMLYKLQVPVKG